MPYKTNANLFELGDFESHAGLQLAWKIECDAVRPEWWTALARMIMDYQLAPFGSVRGIPTGGLALEAAMQQYVTPGNYPALIVDDVYTTGTSFREFKLQHYPNQTVYQWCIFARQPTANGVRALFTMPG